VQDEVVLEFTELRVISEWVVMEHQSKFEVSQSKAAATKVKPSNNINRDAILIFPSSSAAAANMAQDGVDAVEWRCGRRRNRTNAGQGGTDAALLCV
jgi:hypothetical protein